mmetsp:Transcript_62412/g.180935  ORF Transcript_62412/g.180935 Transcript_62412/m.180935 type:complete len:903 (-) Transcript_62412:56-2764(-)
MRNLQRFGWLLVAYNALPHEAEDEVGDVSEVRPSRRRRGCCRHVVFAAAAASLISLMTSAGWRIGSRSATSRAVPGAVGPQLPLRAGRRDHEASGWQEAMRLESAFDVGVVWVGCFSRDRSGSLGDGPSQLGYTTQTCAQACIGNAVMALQDSGRCICGSRYAERPQSQQVFDGDCGEVCPGEDSLIPMRYCGTRSNKAVYRLVDYSAAAPAPAPTTTAPAPLLVADAEVDQSEEEFVGTWLFGQERSKCLIARAEHGGQLSFAVPLPRGQVAAGPLLETGTGWLQAELSSNDNEDVGTIRIRSGHAPGTLISNFKYPGDAVWGKDTVAHKTEVPRSAPATLRPATQLGTPQPAGGASKYVVAAPHGLYVRATASTMATILGTRLAGIIVEGIPQGDWLKLTQEPGFMLMRQHGAELMRRVGEDDVDSSSNRMPGLAVTSAVIRISRTASSTTMSGPTVASSSTRTATKTTTTQTTTSATTTTLSTTTTLWGQDRWATWQVVTPHGLNVRAGKSGFANVIATKPAGAKVLGKRFGEWLQLKEDMGFVMISNGDKEFLQPVIEPGSEDPLQEGPSNDDEPMSALKESQAVEAVFGASGKSVGIFCYALMMPAGYETGLLRAQAKRAVGIFDCDDYAVFSNVSISLGKWNSTGPKIMTYIVKGSLDVPLGGTWHTALNTGIFLRVWRAVLKHGGFRHYDWTVKADADCVFFPSRLRVVLQLAPMDSVPLFQRDSGAQCGSCRLEAKKEETCAAHIQGLERHGLACEQALEVAARRPPDECGCLCGSSSCFDGLKLGAMFLVNCRFGLHGPIEVLSREAVNIFVAGIPKCATLRKNPWGEDKYLDHCLQKLGVRRVLKFDLLNEIACGQPAVDCGSPAVAFHPFKDAANYFGCMAKAGKTKFAAK